MFNSSQDVRNDRILNLVSLALDKDDVLRRLYYFVVISEQLTSNERSDIKNLDFTVNYLKTKILKNYDFYLKYRLLNQIITNSDEARILFDPKHNDKDIYNTDYYKPTIKELLDLDFSVHVFLGRILYTLSKENVGDITKGFNQ
jgi:hypothetical protein